MKKEELLKLLEEYCPIQNLEKLLKEIEEATEKEKKQDLLEQLQTLNEAIYNHFGFNDATLELQAYINKIRYEEDIHDPTEVIPRNDDEKWVQ